jgi:hypothetical protein
MKIKNKKAQISVNIFVLGTLTICLLAIFSYILNTNKIKYNFEDISALEQAKIQSEKKIYETLYKNLFFTPDTKDYQNPCDIEPISFNINYFFKDIKSELDIDETISNPGICKQDDGKNIFLNKILKINSFKQEYVGAQCLCGEKCKEYGEIIFDESCKENIDPYLILSIMMQESNCNPSAKGFNKINGEVSSYDCGLMQINTKSLEYCKNLINDPKLVIKEGINILKNKPDNSNIFNPSKNGICTRNIKYSNWPAKIRGYNGWGSGGSDYYVELILRRYLELKDLTSERYTPGEVKTSSEKVSVDYSISLDQ